MSSGSMSSEFMDSGSMYDKCSMKVLLQTIFLLNELKKIISYTYKQFWCGSFFLDVF
jgi:hypothetical protein